MSGDQNRTTRRLDVATNIVMIVACVVISTGVVQRSWGSAGRPPTPSSQVYKVGERIAPPEGLRLDGHSQTVLLYLSSRCRYCTESMPFYNQLAIRMRGGGFNIIVLGPEPKESLAAYVREHRLNVGDVVSVTPATFRVAPTPTVVIVDRNGVVKGSWTGLLGKREAEVNRALDAGTRR